jgi:Domain of unknown function (DUF4350)
VTRGWRIGLSILAVVVAVNVALRVLRSYTGGSPGGPTSSSYATRESGAAAYAELLARAGHRVERLRERPDEARLDPRETLVLLDPGFVARRDADALHRFLAGGGRLVLGGEGGRWLGRVVPSPPVWSPDRVGDLRALAPAPELAGVRRVETAGKGSWAEPGAAVPVLGGPVRALLDVAAVGRGRLLLLADASPLQNRLLGRADDAALGLGLAGPPARRVRFLESYHGYGRASGFAAIPGRWWAAFGLLLAAALALMLARGRRLGPPQAAGRELPPPRREYVESLGGVLARSRRRQAAIEPVRARARALVARRAALGSEPSDDELRQAAVRLGFPPEGLFPTGAADTDADVVAAGRALARAERESAP